MILPEADRDLPVQRPHRVLLIRPWDMPDGVGAGCCGGGSTKGLCVATPEERRGEAAPHVERAGWEPFAAVYLALKEALAGDAELEVVDPRNHLYLVPVLIGAARRRGSGWWEAVRSALRAPGYAAIIVDGQTVSSGALPRPEEAVRLVRRALGGRFPAGSDGQNRAQDPA